MDQVTRPGASVWRSGLGMRWMVPLALVVVITATACSADSATPPSSVPPADTPAPTTSALPRQLFGAFLGSDQTGVDSIPGFEAFLGGRQVRVGHTYLPGEGWDGVEGPDFILDPWAQWKSTHPDDLFVLNVPLATPNEADLSDGEVAGLLRQGAAGAFDRHFTTLASRLVEKGLQDAVLVPGWEMNGTTYSHRCSPDPESWKQYYRRVVEVMRAQPGQDFHFDFNPSRGTDDISWAECYPGDDVVDIIGMDTYDQPPGESWDDYVSQPDGLQAQVDFARQHGKPVSYPEWGLFRFGDNAQYIRDMHEWITRQDTVYTTITDYCPHGVWECGQNPDSAQAVRELFGRTG